jgi:Tol biopolymer transport system component
LRRTRHLGRAAAWLGLVLVLIVVYSGAGLQPQPVAAQSKSPEAQTTETPPFHTAYDGPVAMSHRSLGAALAAGRSAMLTPQYAAWSRLVFQSARNEHDWEIYAARGDGSDAINLSHHDKSDVLPRLNRTATHVVFASDRHGNYDIFVMNADGSGQTRLTDAGSNDTYPAWSPDGSRIAFQSYRDGQAEIYVMNADGSGQTRLTDHGDYDGEPAWSPDGTQIAFVRRASGLYRIWVMNANGSSPRQLSNQPYSEAPIWSPDGSQIAYDSDGNGDGWQELWLMDATGGNQRQVYDPPEYDTDAWARGWSPDGRYVTFTRISFIQQGSNWYWTAAYLDAWDSANPSNAPMRLSGTGMDWYPDWQSLDLQPPISSVQPLPVQSPASFVVQWTGTDTGPAGIASFDLQVRDGPAGPWTDWRAATSDRSAVFTGIGNHTYHFRARARDHAGNVESWRAGSDASTTVEARPPVTAIQPLPAFTRGAQIPVHWAGIDPGGSGMQNYDVQVRQDMGAWTDWRMGATESSAMFSGQAGGTYGFRVRGRDQAQNLEAWPAAGADAATTFYTWTMTGNATDNRGAPIVGMTIHTTPAAFREKPSDGAGEYAAYVSTQAASYTTHWSKAGYSALPATASASTYDSRSSVVLPPADNVVQDWGFENAGDAQSLSGSAWQFGGSLSGTITNTDRHSGMSAAFLGTDASPLRSVTTLAGPLRNFNPAVDSAMDAAGVLHCVWLEPDGRIMYTSKPPAGPWSMPTPLPGPPAHYGGSVKLLADDSGTIHAVWVGETTLHYSQKRTGAAWSTPESIPGTISTWSEPGIAIGKTGILKLVYVGIGSSGVGYGDAYFTERSIDGVWTSPRNISSTYGPDDQFRMAMDPSGGVHVLWNASDTSGMQDIFYAAENDDGSWLPAVNLSEYDSHVGDAGMVVDSHGVIHVVWNADGIYYRSRAGNGSWSSKRLIASAGYGGVSLFADERDRVHLAWGDSISSQLHYALGANGSWSSPVNVTPPTAIPSQSAPRLLLAENGTAHLLWLQYQEQNDWSIRYSVQNEIGQWSAPVAIYENDHDTLRPRFFVDHLGVPHAIWSAYLSNGYAVMHAGSAPGESAGEATLAQAIQLPDAALAPTLSFWHRFGAEFASTSHLEVRVNDMLSSALVFSSTAGTNAWQHQWADLTPWAGRPVTISFLMVEAAGGSRAWAYIDEVSVGSARPDTWLRLISPGATPPGQDAVHTLSYGNRGGVIASNAHVTLQLPPELTFVRADPPPSAVSQGLRWNVNDLAGQSEAVPIRVTLRVASSATRGTTVTTTASIGSDTAELEQANNTAKADTFIGSLAYLPMLAHD